MFVDVLIPQRSARPMSLLLRHLRPVLISGTALALSAGLVFGATPPAASTGLANAAAHAAKTVPVVSGDETTGDDDQSVDEQDETTGDDDQSVDEPGETESPEAPEAVDEDADTQDAADSCTDPSAATPEELAAMNHGAMVCWAAQQTAWPTWFSNHGAFVRCWAHQGKADATSCTEDPTAVEGTTAEPTSDQAPATHGNGHGKGHGKAGAKGKAKHLQ
jgi:hypothetical protein